MSGYEIHVPSPDERREARKDYRWERERQLMTQRALLEKLRYKGYVERGTLTRIMQRLGDWGRAHFPFIGRGWNGIGGGR